VLPQGVVLEENIFVQVIFPVLPLVLLALPAMLGPRDQVDQESYHLNSGMRVFDSLIKHD
jgi:hypothetical protein